MKYILTGFKYKNMKKQKLIYKENISSSDILLKSIYEGIEKGCNVFSIRGFEE